MAICFRDRTFCISINCVNACGAKLTDEIRRDARTWWLDFTNGCDDQAPIAMSEFCDEHGNEK